MKNHEIVNSESSPIEYIKLGTVLAVIVIASWFFNENFGTGGWAEYLRWFMGVFFVVFALFKFIGYKMFAMMFTGYDIVAKRFKPYSYAYPFIEFGLGVLYIADAFATPRDIVTFLVMFIGIIGVAQEIKKRSDVHCACLGNIIKLPLSTVSLLEDAGMGIMATIMLLAR